MTYLLQLHFWRRLRYTLKPHHSKLPFQPSRCFQSIKMPSSFQYCQQIKSLNTSFGKYFALAHVFMISPITSAAYLQIVSDIIASLNVITYSLYTVMLAADWTL